MSEDNPKETKESTESKEEESTEDGAKENASPEKKKIAKFGTQVAKSKVIYAFANGDKHHKGAKMTLKQGKSFDQIMQDMTILVKIPTGAVRQVFTVDGKKIKSIDQFEDEGQYICAGAEKFNKDHLPLVLINPPKDENASSPAKPASVAKATPTPPKEKKPITKFGTQSEKAKVIYVFRNGDKHHQGVKMTIHATKFKTFDQVKAAMTKEVQLPTGAVMKVFTDKGKPVKAMEDFEDEGKYITAGAEKLNKELMPSVLLENGEKKEEPQEKEEKKVPVKKAEPKPKEAIKKFGTQSETAKVIYVFRNGDKNHEGVKMTIHPTKFKTFDQVKEAMTKQVGVVTGSVRQVFHPDGRLIKSMDMFENEGQYVAAGAEKLNKTQMATAIKKTEDSGGDDDSQEQPAPTP